MTVSPLHLVEKDTMDKEKALEAALGQIERSFGKGSIMKLGQREQAVDIEAVSTGSLGLDIGLGIGGLPGAVLSRFMGLKALVRPRWHCMLLQKRRKPVVRALLSMRNMR